MNAASYYSELTAHYEHYSAGTHGWHYGIWEPDVRSHAAALLRSNELLLRGLRVDAGTRILDVGFGIGGFAVWAASTSGAHVTGITVAADHLAAARDLARRQGVSHLCEFVLMDMDAMTFPPGGFDVVVNQETFCHAADKRQYLAAVRKVLRSGGSWRAVDFAVRDAPLEPGDRDSYDAVCRGFFLPSMISMAETSGMLRAAGFSALDGRDVSAETLKTAGLILKACVLPRLAAQLGLDWTFRPGDPVRRAHRRGHVDAAFHYSRGLRRGIFRHAFYSAGTP